MGEQQHFMQGWAGGFDCRCGLLQTPNRWRTAAKMGVARRPAGHRGRARRRAMPVMMLGRPIQGRAACPAGDQRLAWLKPEKVRCDQAINGKATGGRQSWDGAAGTLVPTFGGTQALR